MKTFEERSEQRPGQFLGADLLAYRDIPDMRGCKGTPLSSDLSPGLQNHQHLLCGVSLTPGQAWFNGQDSVLIRVLKLDKNQVFRVLCIPDKIGELLDLLLGSLLWLLVHSFLLPFWSQGIHRSTDARDRSP